MSLKVGDLKEHIEVGLKNIVNPAIERIESLRYTDKSEIGKRKAREIRDMWDDMVSDALSEVIAQAIDYYIKNADITGTIITVGSPFTQEATIFSTQVPIVNGTVPNTLGIS
jgi:hypothetical protein